MTGRGELLVSLGALILFAGSLTAILLVVDRGSDTKEICCSIDNQTCIVPSSETENIMQARSSSLSAVDVQLCNANETMCSNECNGWMTVVAELQIMETPAPTAAPTAQVVGRDTVDATSQPTPSPSVAPTPWPPTPKPSKLPTTFLNFAFTAVPTGTPPSGAPSTWPTGNPSATPSTTPSSSPSISPSFTPSLLPTSSPTNSPTVSPTVAPTALPTVSPTSTPTTLPTNQPTSFPTRGPSEAPTDVPTKAPTAAPTSQPTQIPTGLPTNRETIHPTDTPTNSPTTIPTDSPTEVPSQSPTAAPSASPSSTPSRSPSVAPSAKPTVSPTTALPTGSPSGLSLLPTGLPTVFPSAFPTGSPTSRPSVSPSTAPSAAPVPQTLAPVPQTLAPSVPPTDDPSMAPTPSPTAVPTLAPTSLPTAVIANAQVSAAPTISPTMSPTDAPTTVPTSAPTARPTVAPTVTKTVAPTPSPTIKPTFSSGHACLPAEKDGRAVALALNGGSGETVVLAKSGQLCTLWQVDSKREKIVPIGRSYHGNDWEPYAGRHESLKFDCDSSFCSLRLPDLSTGYTYELASFDHELPERDVVARFLEQSTFGPTRAALDSFPESFAEWIQGQQETVPMTLHRQIFRQNVANRDDKPSTVGVTTRPCEKHSRYRQYAFTNNDRQLEIFTDPETDRKVLIVDGARRTVLEHTKMYIHERGKRENEIKDGIYSICRLSGDNIGTAMRLQTDQGCDDVEFEDGERMTNPAVFFDEKTQPNVPVVSVDGFAREVDDEVLELTKNLKDGNCDLIHPLKLGVRLDTVGVYDGKYWLFEPQVAIRHNSVDDPLEDGGGDLLVQTRLEDDSSSAQKFQVQCSNPGMNFVNEDGCMISYDADACTPRDPSDEWVSLELDTFQKIFEASGSGDFGTRYVYTVEGLRQERGEIPYDPPCTPGETSRWTKVDCSETAVAVENETSKIFEQLIKDTDDENPFVIDITFPATGDSCASKDTDKFDFQVFARGQCWQNVHQSHLQVYDFTDWINQHPGGKEPITAPADAEGKGSFRLEYPDWHGMDRFHGWSAFHRKELGRYGDSVRFSDLPSELTTESIARSLGTEAALLSVGAAVVCGSPGEVSSNPQYVGERMSNAFRLGGGDEQKKQIWLHIALTGEDGLRQRVAWALSQILVVSQSGVGFSAQATEGFTAYYDIFVRNAFGNYRDILKEVSFSPLMAEMLTFMENKSTDYLWSTRRRVEFADENYAREIMQLFSIGLIKLNNDGTAYLDDSGDTIRTYTNKEIVEYARVWTGFKKADRRGNIESTAGNLMDPMPIEGDWRDSFPKLGLDGQYVGDGLPLCSDLPDRHFLRPGATYHLLGSIGSPKFHREPSFWASSASVVRMQLEENSSLYAKLCDRKQGRCQYPPKVVLDEEISCRGVECEIEVPRLVEVEPGVFYEYLRMPCALQAFFPNGQVVGQGSSAACADPRTQVGGIACCTEESNTFTPEFDRFSGERVSFTKAEAICTESELLLCEKPTPSCGVCDSDFEYWSSISCAQQAKIFLDGRVGIVHSVSDHDSDQFNILRSVREDTKTYFGVLWSPLGSGKNVEEDILPDYDEMCASLGCERDSYDNLCLCSVEVEESDVFDSPPSHEQVLSELHVGAFNPNVYWGSHSVNELGNGVKMHSFNGSFSSESVFEVVDDNGVQRFLKNLRSDVVIGKKEGLKLSFRNPSHMISIHDPDLRDAYHETDAALDQYFYHPNTAPFLAVRFAQRFGFSNPSPRYVGTVATAFRTGMYVDDLSGISFGKGEYGDMGSMIAALLLDREARTVVLDADPAQGSLLEPFLRLIRIMKSLEFDTDHGVNFATFAGNLYERIGEGPHDLPDVFSFFLPGFTPRGVIGDSGLVAPETQELNGPRLIELLNGMLSLLKYGADWAYEGFFDALYKWQNVEGDRKFGEYIYGDGWNRYKPTPGLDSKGAIDELATLLTSGRLSQEKRDFLRTIYEEYDDDEAYINIQQLLLTSPEFNTNGLARSIGVDRDPPEQRPPPERPYKAVIQVQLIGGWDSFNVLIPAECKGKNAAGKTVDEQYMDVRGEMAIRMHETDLRIDVDSSQGQPCHKFAIHKSLPVAKELYDEGSLVFLANAGVINSAEMTKQNYNTVTVSKLFSHNDMQEEMERMDPFIEEYGTGLLGRMSSVLEGGDYRTAAITVDGASYSLGGSTPLPLVVSNSGAKKYNVRPRDEKFPLAENAAKLNTKSDTYSSLFGETWSAQYMNGVEESAWMNELLDSTTLDVNFEKSKVGKKLAMAARLIQTKDDRGVDRDLIFIKSGSWDHHGNARPSMEKYLDDLNVGLKNFVDQLKSQGSWDDVVVVVTSDFGRTLTQNGREGTDHAWGGHYMLIGGGLKGGRILGKYPEDLTEEGPWNLGRGRIMPTMSWETIWYGVAEWAGVEKGDMEKCLPNLENSYGPGFESPLKASELFKKAPQKNSIRGSDIFGN